MLVIVTNMTIFSLGRRTRRGHLTKPKTVVVSHIVSDLMNIGITLIPFFGVGAKYTSVSIDDSDRTWNTSVNTFVFMSDFLLM
jgi:hypothetical protein